MEENLKNIKPNPIPIPPPTSASVLPPRATAQFIILTDVPENISGSDLWNEFGGNGIVQKVSLDYQGSKRTGIVYFTNEVAAKKAYLDNFQNNKWKNHIIYSGNHSSPPSTTSSNTVALSSPSPSSSTSSTSTSTFVTATNNNPSNNSNNINDNSNNNNINNTAINSTSTLLRTNPDKNVEQTYFDVNSSFGQTGSVGNITENRLVAVRGDQLPHFFQDVLKNLGSILYNEQTNWKRNIIADYLFCQVLTEMLKPNVGIPIQLIRLQQQLKDTFGAQILVLPLRAFLRAYPEFFEVDKSGILVRAIKSELPPLDFDSGIQMGPTSTSSSYLF